MEWEPAAKPEVEKVAIPPLNAPLPKVIAPSKKVTVPLAVAGETVAVKVTDCPGVDGLRLDARPIVVLVLVEVFTVCVRMGEMVPL